MAQFQVYLNRGRNKEHIPYFVLLQSAVFDSSPRRVVCPLVRREIFGQIENERFNPAFIIQGKEYVLQPLELASLPAPPPGDLVCSLKSSGDQIVGATDELFSRGYG